jgi:hypothetical protein
MRAYRESKRRRSWWTQPIAWLGILVLAASLTGCIWLILVAARYGDARTPSGHQVFGVPLQQ